MNEKQTDEFKNYLFSTLKKEVFDAICQNSFCKVKKKGDTLFLDKEEVKYIMILISGEASIYKITQQSDLKIIFVLKKYDVLNEEILMYDEVSTNCEALSDVKVLYIDKKVFMSQMSKDFTLSKFILESNIRKNRRLYRQVKNNSTIVKTDKKVASKLWKLAYDHGVKCDKGVKINVDLSVTYLSKMIGAKRETTSRAVKSLIDQKLIEIENNKFIILDEEALSNFFYE